MPLFEEKWMSPLAIRFTQDHIRTTFRDGRLVEGSIPQIRVRPAPVGSDYDVVLYAPFPHIEIVRWKLGLEENSESESSHWFTLDNRRLYCLQRAAVVLWPKRVAAVVEILYNDLGRMRRKFDSETCGWSVSISHHLKEKEICRWDWRLMISGLARASLEALADSSEVGSAESVALEALLDDDEKKTTQELANAPEEQGMVAAFFADADGRGPPASQRSFSPSSEGLPSVARSTASTCPSNADSDSLFGEAARTLPPATNMLLIAALKTNLDDSVWQGQNGEVYTLLPRNESSWTAVRTNAGHGPASKKFTVAFDKQSGCLWWGGRASLYYVDAHAFLSQAGVLRWHGWNDVSAFPRFIWVRSSPAPCLAVCESDA